MKQQFTLKSWSRIACRYAGKLSLLLLILMMGTAARAQHAEVDGQRTLKPGSLSHLLHKHASSGEFTQSNLPKASESLRRMAHDASGELLNFPERVVSRRVALLTNT